MELLAPSIRAFASREWGSDAFESLDSPVSRDAWLGYVALALSMHRLVDPRFPHTALHDRMIAGLRARVEASPTMLFETYPGETYPVDVAHVVAAIALHARATGGDVEEFVGRWTSKVGALIDPVSRYLSQTGPGVGSFRGSGTAMTAYAIGFADPAFSKKLFDALRRSGVRSIAGFSAIRENPLGRQSRSDVASGQILFGVSVSDSGLTVASTKRFGDRALFTRLMRTVELGGLPYSKGERVGYAVGGPLGDAMLLAMITTPTPEQLERFRQP